MRNLSAFAGIAGLALVSACRSSNSGAANTTDRLTSAGGAAAAAANVTGGRESLGTEEVPSSPSSGTEDVPPPSPSSGTDLSGYTPIVKSPARAYFLPWVSTRFHEKCELYQAVVWIDDRGPDVREVLAQTLRVYPELKVVEADPRDRTEFVLGVAATSQSGPDGTTPVVARCSAPEACEHFVAIVGRGGAQVAMGCASATTGFAERFDPPLEPAARGRSSPAGRCAWVSQCASRSLERGISCDLIASDGIGQCFERSTCEEVTKCIFPFLPKHEQRWPNDPE